MERLKSLVIEGAMLYVVAFSIRPKILSGPLDLDTSIFRSRWRISSSVHRILSGHSSDAVRLCVRRS